MLLAQNNTNVTRLVCTHVLNQREQQQKVSDHKPDHEKFYNRGALWKKILLSAPDYIFNTSGGTPLPNEGHLSGRIAK